VAVPKIVVAAIINFGAQFMSLPHLHCGEPRPTGTGPRFAAVVKWRRYYLLVVPQGFHDYFPIHLLFSHGS